MYHIFFIHSFVDGHLGCFHVLAIVKSAAVNILFTSVLSNSLRPHELQHTRPPCPSPTPGVYSNSCPLSRWCHPAISSSVVPFSSHLQSFPASGSFQLSQFFTSGGQSLSFRISPSNEYSGLISVRMDWLDCMVILFLSFWETSIVFSTVTTPAYTPTSLHSHPQCRRVPFSPHPLCKLGFFKYCFYSVLFFWGDKCMCGGSFQFSFFFSPLCIYLDIFAEQSSSSLIFSVQYPVIPNY